MPDFEACNHGSIIMLTPITEAGEDWIACQLAEDAPRLGNSVAIEPRCFGDIAEGIARDGMIISFVH